MDIGKFRYLFQEEEKENVVYSEIILFTRLVPHSLFIRKLLCNNETLYYKKNNPNIKE